MNITCISDIHLDSFVTHEFYKGFRDEQFIRAAKRTIEISKKNDSKVLCILGDLIDHPVLAPHAVHLLMNFVEILSSYYDKIYYILGQHDLDTKIKIRSDEDSIVNILSRFSDKFEHMHNKLIEIGGRSIYFRDWEPVDKIEDVPNCDVFLSHVTLGWYGQKLENDKFKLGIFGDIHTVVDEKNAHSVGGFLQKCLSDAPYGKVVIINLDDLSWKRYNIPDQDNKFLRIYKDEVTDPVDEYTIIRKTHKSSTMTTLQLKDSNNEVKTTSFEELDKVITERLSANDLLDIHREVVNNCVMTDPIDFNFELLNIKIVNYRSIKELDLNLEKYQGLTFISGHNGSGKSSLVNAIKLALMGDRFIARNIKIGENHLKVELKLKYQNHEYDIIRSNGHTEFKCDGSPVSKNNKTALDGYIIKTLPFISYLNLFSMTACEDYYNKLFNSNLIKKLFGIDNFIKFLAVATDRLSKLSRALATSESSKTNNLGKLEVIDKLIEENQKKKSELENSYVPLDKSEKDLIHKIISLRDSISSSESNLSKYSDLPELSIDEYKDLLSSKDELHKAELNNGNISNYNHSISDKKSELEKLNSSKTEIICPECHYKWEVKVQSIEDRKLLLTKSINELESQLSNLKLIDTTELKKKVSRLNELSVLKDKLDKKLALQELIEESKKNLSMVDDKYKNNSNADLRDLITKDEITSNKISELNRLISTKTAERESLVKENSELEVSIEDYKSNITKYRLYISLFDEKSPNSIHKEVLLKISESLSDSELSFLSSDAEDNLGLRLLVDGSWIDYTRCSTGQRARMNLKIISKLLSIVGNCGLVVLDEATAGVDVDNIPYCMDAIRNLSENCKSIFFISHNSILTNDYDNKLDCELVNGCSIYT